MACVAFGKNGSGRTVAINPQANEDRFCACQSTIEIEQLYVDGGVGGGVGIVLINTGY